MVLEISTGPRRAQRFPVEQVVAVKSTDGQFPDTAGVSQNVSASGIFFYADSELPVGAPLELFLMMPPQSGFVFPTFPLRCVGSVVRTTKGGERYGIGVQFEKIEVMAEA